MPRRMKPRERRALLEAVILRDGDICKLCRETPVIDRTIDHVNGKPSDNRLENLVLLCRACNTAEGNRARRGQRLLTPATLPMYTTRAAETVFNANGSSTLPARLGARVTPVRVSERERTGADRPGWSSAEEAANLVMEPTYRLWLFRWVREHGWIGREDAIDAGAEHLDQTVGRASQQTIERYFRKVISSVGWLEERRDPGSKPVWTFRSGTDLDALQAMLEGRMRALGPQEDVPGAVHVPAADPSEMPS